MTERGDYMQERAIGWMQTLCCCGEVTAFAHGAHAPPSELPGRPTILNIYLKLFLASSTQPILKDQLFH